jgi:hypothetical protein
MEVTVERLLIGAERARTCKQYGFERTLRSMADWLLAPGGSTLSEAQLSYAESILERFTDEAYHKLTESRAQIQVKWDMKDPEWIKWMEFLTCFYVSGNCTSNVSHVQWYSMNARTIRDALFLHLKGEASKCPVEDIHRLLNTKLVDNLRACFEADPKFAVGDLVSIRGTSPTFSAYRCITYGFDSGYRYGMPTYRDRKVKQPYKTALVTEVLNATFSCRQVHPTKGSTRLYRITAFTGGQQDECWIEEDQLKMLR